MMNYTNGSKDKAGKTTEFKKAPIFFSMGLFAALFFAMSVYLCFFVQTKQEDMVNNSYNSRQEIMQTRNTRGTIFSRDGIVLAQTITRKDDTQERIYPYGKAFAHVVGYATNGKMGVEEWGNYYLIQSSISLSNKVSNDVAGQKNPGDSIYTTLDYELQRVVDDQLGEYRGAVVITQVKTGQMYVMVSHPNFDPNEIAEIWDDILADKNSSVLLNRVTNGLYPPGSTFKICTALEYYRQNKDTYLDYRFQCNGNILADGYGVECFHGTKHGLVDFKASFVDSCNSSFANMGLGMDWGKYETTMKTLLFNKTLPASFKTAKSQFVSPEGESTAMLMQTSFGQGKTLMTPLHLNMITCAIANDGLLMKPYVMDRVVSAEGEIVKQFQPTKYGPLMDTEEAALLQSVMKAAVEEGTYKKLKNLPYQVAGKTGSAEFSSNKAECHSWFTGYAPADDPEIALTLIMEGAGTGGDYAVPLARVIFDAYFNNQ